MGQFSGPNFQECDIHMFRTGNFADGVIKCDGRAWKVHRSLLASRLNFFRAAFYGKFSEAASKQVDFPEADPVSVGLMLRHLYSEELNIKAFNTPISCIRCWKLADYVKLNSLKCRAEFTLRQHLDAMALLACSNEEVEEEQPTWLRSFFDAFQEVCGDVATEPLRTTFVAFLWVTRHKLLVLPETLEILEKWPEVNKELLTLFVRGDIDEKPSWIPDQPNIESHIQNRREVIFPNTMSCFGCNREINTCEEMVSYNPFPIGNLHIGQVMWCRECVFEFNEECSWPWRREEWMKLDLDKL